MDSMSANPFEKMANFIQENGTYDRDRDQFTLTTNKKQLFFKQAGFPHHTIGLSDLENDDNSVLLPSLTGNACVWGYDDNRYIICIDSHNIFYIIDGTSQNNDVLAIMTAVLIEKKIGSSQSS